ncbi:MAG: hypothetical protein HQ501_09845 [Rhodospirillales bacterium]|nr:hypothetical protein [Rhodospirillales bacterium]
MPQTDTRNFIDRTVWHVRSAWQRIAGGEYDEEVASLRPDLPPDDIGKIRKQMQECLDSKGGEVSARAKAAALGRVYMHLMPEVGKNSCTFSVTTSMSIMPPSGPAHKRWQV